MATQQLEQPGHWTAVEGLERPPVAPTALVLFGATGDLARRKLLPAIYNLAYEGALPERFELMGVSRAEVSDEQFRELAARCARRFSRRAPDAEVLGRLLEGAHHITGTFEQAAVYGALRGALAAADERAHIPLNRCFYLATPPRSFGLIVARLADQGLNRSEDAEVRVAIEKPFGTNLAEAKQLNREVLSVFTESQVFRIDHFLGKETVQNMLALRFANQIFEPVWNRNYVDHVQITAAEDIGIGTRGEFYDSTGALRDLVQNHLLQLLSQVAMEPPVDFSADGVRSEKVKLLRAIEPPAADTVDEIAVRGQYTAGSVGGRQVRGYLEEEGVAPDSRTETFAALRLEVANWRWAGVPFYLRTGKRLARELTEVALTLKPVPHLALVQDGSLGAQPNQLILRIDPDEAASLLLVAKIPGPRMRVRPVKMEFRYGTSFLTESPDAYERLILDVVAGDQTLFTGGDEVELQWRICDPIVDAWRTAPDGPAPYPAGSHGPVDAASLLRAGHAWRRI